MVNREVISLVKRVFGTDDGAKLLKHLNDAFRDVPLFSSDEKLMAYNVGKADLVLELHAYLTMDETKTEEIIFSNQDPFDI